MKGFSFKLETVYLKLKKDRVNGIHTQVVTFPCPTKYLGSRVTVLSVKTLSQQARFDRKVPVERTLATFLD